jgi:hypothetical protein
VTPSVPDAFTAGDGFVALAERITDSRWAAEIEARACTPEQADDPGYGYFARGRGFAAHLRTHAESVVGDMTRATLLNPGLMDDARPYLEAARDQLGPAEFSRLTVQAEMTLRRSGG